MSIQKLLNTQPPAEGRRSAAGRSKPAGTSFQDQLVQTTAHAQAKPSPAGDSGRTACTKDELFSALFDFKSSMLERMKLSKEKAEEQQSWDRLMKYLDAWIESLRDEADVRKIARAHAALTALQTDAESGREDLGDYLLAQLENMIA